MKISNYTNGKKLSVLILISIMTALIAIGMVSDIKSEITVAAVSRNCSYEHLDGAPKEAMTVAYTNTVYNEKDYITLCRIVEAEASGEDLIGKIMVANVILNRVDHERFPDSVYNVVYAPGQFSPVSSGKINRVQISESTKEAVERALSGEDYSNGALYFAARRYASASNMSWFDRALTKVAIHGGHEFFTM